MVGSADGDGVVPGPRSAGVPGPTPEPRSPELSALLADIDQLRLVLAADLGAAASAVEAGALDVAADMLAGGQDDLHVFADRAAGHLHADGPSAGLTVVRDEPSDEPSDEPGGVPAAPVPARTRVRRLLPAGPALAAAAIIGVLLGLTPDASTTAPRPTPTAAAAATYAELYRLYERGAPAPALRAAALELRDRVERLVEVAPEDPAAAEQALRLLSLGVAVLDGSEHRAELLDALAETQQLLVELQAVVAASTPPAGLPGGLEVPQLPVPTPPAPTPHRGSSRPAAEPAPAPHAEQAPASDPAPVSSSPAPPSPAPSDEPAAEPSPEPSSGSQLFPDSRTPLSFRKL